MSEEVKEMRKTTKAAKLAGVLAGLATCALNFFIWAFIAIGYFHEILGYPLNDTVEYMLFGLSALGILPSVFVGLKVNNKWESFTKRKKIILTVTSLLLISPFVIEGYERLDIPKSDDSVFKEGERIRVYTTNDKSFKGRFLKWNDDFIILKYVKEVQIPKDKIHYIERGW